VECHNPLKACHFDAASSGGSTNQQLRQPRSGGSYLSQNDMRAHFGLGAAASADQVTIRWPSGQVDTAVGVAADRFYIAREGSGLQLDPRSSTDVARR
jgi:hypothetical protein